MIEQGTTWGGIKLPKSESFHYQPKKDTEEGYMFHDVRSRVEREAMERMTRIYEDRKGQTSDISYDPSYSMEQYRKSLIENFPSISDSDVYGQTQTK